MIIILVLVLVLKWVFGISQISIFKIFKNSSPNFGKINF